MHHFLFRCCTIVRSRSPPCSTRDVRSEKPTSSVTKAQVQNDVRLESTRRDNTAKSDQIVSDYDDSTEAAEAFTCAACTSPTKFTSSNRLPSLKMLHFLQRLHLHRRFASSNMLRRLHKCHCVRTHKLHGHPQPTAEAPQGCDHTQRAGTSTSSRKPTARPREALASNSTHSSSRQHLDRRLNARQIITGTCRTAAKTRIITGTCRIATRTRIITGTCRIATRTRRIAVRLDITNNQLKDNSESANVLK